MSASYARYGYGKTHNSSPTKRLDYLYEALNLPWQGLGVHDSTDPIGYGCSNARGESKNCQESTVLTKLFHFCFGKKEKIWLLLGAKQPNMVPTRRDKIYFPLRARFECLRLCTVYMANKG